MKAVFIDRDGTLGGAIKLNFQMNLVCLMELFKL